MKKTLAALTIGLSVLVQSPLRAEVNEPSPTVTEIPAPVSNAPKASSGPSYNDPKYTKGASELTALGNATVQVFTDEGTGSGTVFKLNSKVGKITAVLSNAHVVAGAVLACKKANNCTKQPPMVSIKAWYSYEGKVFPLFYHGRVMVASFDPELDLVLIKLEEPWVGEYANFAPEDLRPAQSEQVYVVGSSLGERTQVSTGLLDLLNIREGKYGVSAPIYPGNSGGGLYISRDKYYFIGVPQAIAVVKQTAAFTHGIVIPASKVRRYLDDLGVEPT